MTDHRDYFTRRRDGSTVEGVLLLPRGEPERIDATSAAVRQRYRLYFIAPTEKLKTGESILRDSDGGEYTVIGDTEPLPSAEGAILCRTWLERIVA